MSCPAMICVSCDTDAMYPIPFFVFKKLHDTSFAVLSFFSIHSMVFFSRRMYLMLVHSLIDFPFFPAVAAMPLANLCCFRYHHYDHAFFTTLLAIMAFAFGSLDFLAL